MSATARTAIYVGYEPQDFDARIMVENILAECGVKNYTIYEAVGHWNGHEETTFVIEVIGDTGENDFAVNEAAHILKHNMDRPQESVYVVRELVDLVVL